MLPCGFDFLAARQLIEIVPLLWNYGENLMKLTSFFFRKLKNCCEGHELGKSGNFTLLQKFLQVKSR
jgi:hypothetical protein